MRRQIVIGKQSYLLSWKYLHRNLYDQAKEMRSKEPWFEAHSNQQFCKYLFYLGNIRTIQLEYFRKWTYVLVDRFENVDHGTAWSLYSANSNDRTFHLSSRPFPAMARTLPFSMILRFRLTLSKHSILGLLFLELLRAHSHAHLLQSSELFPVLGGILGSVSTASSGRGLIHFAPL